MKVNDRHDSEEENKDPEFSGDDSDEDLGPDEDYNRKFWDLLEDKKYMKSDPRVCRTVFKNFIEQFVKDSL